MRFILFILFYNRYNVASEIKVSLKLSKFGMNTGKDRYRVLFSNKDVHDFLDIINIKFVKLTEDEKYLLMKDDKTFKKDFFGREPFKASLLHFRERSSIIKFKMDDKYFILKRTYDKDEYNLSSVFNHKNIVETYYTLERGKCIYKKKSKKIYWIFMEYLDQELDFSFDINNKNNDFDSEKTRKICLDILNGLKYLHEQEYVHMDLKPSNIRGKLIKNANEENITYKIFDFGHTIKYGEEIELGGKYYGTEFYYSRDTHENKKVIYKSDIWAFGCMLFYNFIYDEREKIFKDNKKKEKYYEHLNVEKHLTSREASFTVGFIEMLKKCLINKDNELNKGKDDKKVVDELLNHNFFKTIKKRENQFNYANPNKTRNGVRYPNS